VKIGIISDSHDNLPKIEKAIKIFNKKKVGFVLHAGDFVAPFVIRKFKDLSCDWRGVFGNNDGEKKGLSLASGGKIQEAPFRIKLDNRNIVLVHDIDIIIPETEEAEVVICGHTHKPEERRLNGKLIINPGECGGWLSGKSTVAIVDLADLSSQLRSI
jgi:putative phosphoesterase